MAPHRALLMLLAAAASASGCAAGREERRAPYIPYELAPQREPDEPFIGARAPARASAGSSLADALSRFASDARAARASLAPGTPPPPAAIARWSAVLGLVDDFLRRPGVEATSLELIRARVALEAERDLDQTHYGALPDGLEASIRARALALEQRVRLARSFRPRPAPEFVGDLRWPVDPVFVTSLFGYRLDPITGAERNHLGVDLKARSGQAIAAAAPGVVVRAGRSGGHGLLVEVLHGGGLRTRYSHLSTALVLTGARVDTGSVLGLAGSTGRSTGPHLHFEVWRGGEPVDPLAELPEPDAPLLSRVGS